MTRVQVTAILLGICLLVPGGVLVFDFASEWYHRQLFEECRAPLQALLSRASTVAEVETELREEPFRVAGPPDAARVARIWTNPSPAAVEGKMRSWPETRIYRKSPMMLFIYFDSRGIMRDFSCLEG